MKSEPVLVAVTAFVAAALTLLIAFDVEITKDQVGAIIGFVAAGYGIALIVRSKVTPTR